MVDFKKCFNVIEILIKNGVDIIIRCNCGYLFIDFFRMFFFWLDEFDVDWGECLLGGDEIELYIRKEKWYLKVMIFIFFVVYILIFFFIVGKKII